jgi:hypothetical protein
MKAFVLDFKVMTYTMPLLRFFNRHWYTVLVAGRKKGYYYYKDQQMLDDDSKECFINEQKVNKIIIKKFL